jgi:hypothetical protein
MMKPLTLFAHDEFQAGWAETVLKPTPDPGPLSLRDL